MSREAFEKWIVSFDTGCPDDLFDRNDKYYSSTDIQRQWATWQAALAQAPAVADKINIAEWLIADFRKEYVGQPIERWLEAAVEEMLKESKSWVK